MRKNTLNGFLLALVFISTVGFAWIYDNKNTIYTGAQWFQNMVYASQIYTQNGGSLYLNDDSSYIDRDGKYHGDGSALINLPTDATKMNLAIPSAGGNLGALNIAGQIYDSGAKIGDYSTSAAIALTYYSQTEIVNNYYNKSAIIADYLNKVDAASTYYTTSNLETHYYNKSQSALQFMPIATQHNSLGGIDGTGNYHIASEEATALTNATASNTASTIAKRDALSHMYSTRFYGDVEGSVTGGTTASANLTLSSTSHETKGKILLGTISAYDEVNDRLGIGTNAPTANMTVSGTTYLHGGLDVGDTAYYDATVAFCVKSNRAYIFNMYNRYVSPVMALTQWGGLAVGPDLLQPGGNLSVKGNVGIGNTYAALAPPTNGLMVEGKVGVGTINPTATLHLKAGTATVSTSPLKFTQASAVVLSSPEAGAIECNDGDELYYTIKTGPTRKTIAYTDSNITGTAAMKLTSPDTAVWTLTIDNDGILTATKP